MIDDQDEFTAYLINEGVLDISADESGEIIFTLGPHAHEKMPEFAETFMQEVQNEIDEALVGLYEKGLIEFVPQDDGEIGFKLSDGVAELLDTELSP